MYKYNKIKASSKNRKEVFVKKRFSNFYYTNYILNKDSKYFNIPLEKLLNIIIKSYVYKNEVYCKKEIISLPMEYIQFTLNKDIVILYKKYIEDRHIVNESEFLREVLLHYASSNNFFREKWIYESNYKKVIDSIGNKETLVFEYKGKVCKEIISFVSHYAVNGYIAVHGEVNTYSLSMMKII